MQVNCEVKGCSAEATYLAWPKWGDEDALQRGARTRVTSSRKFQFNLCREHAETFIHNMLLVGVGNGNDKVLRATTVEIRRPGVYTDDAERNAMLAAAR